MKTFWGIRVFIICSLMFSNLTNLCAQIDDVNTVYKDLEVVKFYSVSMSSSRDGGRSTYTVNNKRVSKSVYDKYHDTWDDMSSCCPCILKSYDENDVLLSEAVSCTDCAVGYYKEFYPNGRLKLQGQFKENPTDDWDDIYRRGYCSVMDGKWFFYNGRGEIDYIELWDEGEFIKQTPESGKAEIWKVELLLNGIVVDTQKVALNKFHELEVSPLYKNSNENSDLKIKLRVVGRKFIEKEVMLHEFKNINIYNLIEKAAVSEIEKNAVRIDVYNGEKNIWNFPVSLKE